MSVSIIDSIKQILDNNTYPAELEFSLEQLASKTIILYGAGNGMDSLYMFVLNKLNIKPAVVLDNKFLEENKTNGIVHSCLKNYNPDREILENALVIITLGNVAVRNEVRNDLVCKGFRNIIFSTDIYEFLRHNPISETPIPFDFYKQNRADIIRAFEIFDESKSQIIFQKVLFTHLFRRYVEVPCETQEKQYFPTDLFEPCVYTRSIICGAYNGDTSLEMIKHCKKIEAMLCLEPDPRNFEDLKKNTLSVKNDIDNLILLPLAVHEKNIQLNFEADNGLSSVITPNGNLLVQCIAIDSSFPDFAPTFISMDIEGAELSALKGMRETIKHNMPKLAISIYHSPEHLWEIVLFLHELVPEYKFYLRNYTSYSFETVLYAK